LPCLPTGRQAALVATSLAPIFLTLWFIELSSAWETKLSLSANALKHWHAGGWYLLASVALALLCFALMRLTVVVK